MIDLVAVCVCVALAVCGCFAAALSRLLSRSSLAAARVIDVICTIGDATAGGAVWHI